jgi:hypothetical protein
VIVHGVAVIETVTFVVIIGAYIVLLFCTGWMPRDRDPFGRTAWRCVSAHNHLGGTIFYFKTYYDWIHCLLLIFEKNNADRSGVAVGVAGSSHRSSGASCAGSL